MHPSILPTNVSKGIPRFSTYTVYMIPRQFCGVKADSVIGDIEFGEFNGDLL